MEKRLVKKICRSGDCVEEFYCLKGLKKMTRAERKKGASDLRKADSNFKTAVKRLARTLNCNFHSGDMLITLDYEDGRRVYEVEFYSGNREYDYEIDAATGDIVSYDFDAEYYNPQQPQTGTMLTEAQVKAIVEARAGTTGTYREFKLDRDDGRIVYEGELRSGWTEYEFTVDAYSGTILEWSLD